ncbi:MAG: cytochrome c [Alphaproteobacteria bacterium]|nr:cytochrome c [Alphaproteobacteria bacterium]MBU1525191.1 cytochrome c [Alphaproteobacteria bacterium]MBU2352187.1 cytochrome c [Alphaproteobacteria bacterium]MBU2381197.1 cytochrome c [Alphaproteobacteria bacterium]
MRHAAPILLAAACVAACAPRPPFRAPDDAAGSAARGAVIARARCGGCHATGPLDESPLRRAPPFRTLSDRYPPSALEEALAEGVMTAHPAMPEFVFDPDEVRDLVAYLETL